MRKLVIQRKKKVVAMVMKLFIYVRVEQQADIEVKGTNLKLLGTVKNGKTFETEITEDATEIYAVFDKTWPAKFHTKILIEPGNTPVHVVTYPRYNPFKGNPFTLERK